MPSSNDNSYYFLKFKEISETFLSSLEHQDVAKLAVSAKATALPVIHNAGHCWPAHTIMKRPGVIRVRFGPIIDTEGKTASEVADTYASWVADNQEVITQDSQ